ncbi:MAG: type III toxin-antitoxin system ToxN/AbiQ family toxin [Lachnospiraceae bacterium]|nr:type III toxin-antitoxin system ToxN/AbiQ family toxin [Lachnospiraceae bacterium]
MQKEFNLYKVDMKYIRNLHQIDDKVMSVSPQIGKDTRVFVGIVVICGKFKYCIPLSSPKEKHKRMKNSLDFSKIEADGKIIGVLNFNLMIPIEEAQIHSIDLSIRKRDRAEIKRYKELCQKELTWCQEHSEVICNKANVLYKTYVSKTKYSGRNRCVEFPRLEQECKKYNQANHITLERNV